MSVKENLWPEIISGINREPVKILNEQGEALAEQTKGRLYGEVLDSTQSDDGRVRYDFYICTSDKPHRFLLLSIDCPFISDYPIVLIKPEHEKIQIVSAYDLKRNLAQVLQSPETYQALQSMLYLATTITSYRYDAGGRIVGTYERNEEILTDEILGIVAANGRVFVSEEAIEDALHVSDHNSTTAYISELCRTHDIRYKYDVMKGGFDLSYPTEKAK